MGPTVWVVPSRLARSKATQTTWCAGTGAWPAAAGRGRSARVRPARRAGPVVARPQGRDWAGRPGARAPSRPQGRCRPGRRRGAGRALWCCGRRHGRAARTGRGVPRRSRRASGVTAGIGDVAPRRLGHGRVGPAGAERGERRFARRGGWGVGLTLAARRCRQGGGEVTAERSTQPGTNQARCRAQVVDGRCPALPVLALVGRGSCSQASRSAAAATTSRTSASLQRRSDEVMAWPNSSTQVGGSVGSVAREFTAGW
jgi:hypothetical protein